VRRGATPRSTASNYKTLKRSAVVFDALNSEKRKGTVVAGSRMRNEGHPTEHSPFIVR
jgi:hypothetical protein